MSKGLCLSCTKKDINCPIEGDDRISVEQCHEYKPTASATVPKHYVMSFGDIHTVEREVFGTNAFTNHLIMAAFEYIARCEKKGNKKADLIKAIDCLTKAVEMLK